MSRIEARGLLVTRPGEPTDPLAAGHVQDRVRLLCRLIKGGRRGGPAEVSPIRSVDKIVVGRGARGPITEKLQSAFFDVVECRVPDEHGWLTYVKKGVGAGAKR